MNRESNQSVKQMPCSHRCYGDCMNKTVEMHRMRLEVEGEGLSSQPEL